MKTFTYMSADGVAALVKAIEDDTETKHQFTFNTADLRQLVLALNLAYVEADRAEVDESDDWAGQFVSGVAITYGIEMI